MSSISSIGHCVEGDEEMDDILLCLHYSCTAAQLLLSLYAKRLKGSELKGIERFSQLLKSNLDVLMSKRSWSENADLCRKAVVKASHNRWIWSLTSKKLQSICGYQSNQEESEMERNHSLLRSQLAKIKQENEWSQCHELMATIRLLLDELKPDAVETIDSVIQVLQMLQNWQKNHNEELLFGSDLKQVAMSDDSLLTVIEMIRFMSVMVELYPHQLVDSLWDFILCSMASWCSTLEESWSHVSVTTPVSSMNNSALLSFTVALCRLVEKCSIVVGGAEANTASLPVNLKTEWNDVFAEVAFTTVIPIFHRLACCWNEGGGWNDGPLCDCLMESMAMSLMEAPPCHVTLNVDELAPLLMAQQPIIQLAAYHLIIKLVPAIVISEGDSMKENADEEEEEEKGEEEEEKKGRAPPSCLLDILNQIKLGELEQVRIGDLHIVEPYSEECSQLIALCLTWKLILHMCGCSSSELRYKYATYLTDSGLMSRLMDNIFCIIPHASLQQVDLEQRWTPDVQLTLKGLQDLAVEVYSWALKYMPAVVRRWCNNADKRTATFVEKFTCKCVSPALCSSDLLNVNSTWDNMMVKVRPSAREVIATYKLNEEASMELVIQLPANYPLGSITVEGGRKVGVTANQWRNWMLQLTTFLMHQNGSILDGLTLWKRNVDKRFEGVEECYICYYVLHGSNYQLPKLSCRTCRKKFHSACLYKWFNTSNNSTCPLCRNLF